MTKEFLSPSEVEKLKKKRIINDESSTTQEEIKQESTPENSERLAENKAGKVKIDFETEGRFDMPKTMYFSGYTIDHIDNFALVTEENIFETLVDIISDLNHDKEINIENMLIEEFFETLIGIKSQFDTINHVHRWICDCQEGEDEKDRVVNELQVNLKTLNYVSITEADEQYRQLCREMFENKSSFDYYVKLKYGKDVDVNEFNVEEEINKMKVEEPYTIQNNGNLYKFRFLRVKDIIVADRYVSKKYKAKIKAVQRKQIHNVKAEELKIIKEEEMEKLNNQKGKDFLRALKSATLVEYNGNIIESLDQKMEIYKNTPIQVSIDSASFLEKFRFGVNQEEEFECPVCGSSDRRSLQLEFNFIEFIPAKSDSNAKLRDATRGNIFMGI